MTRPGRHLVPPHPREALTRLAWSLAAGAAIGALMSLDDPRRLPASIAGGAWVGACIFLASVLLGPLLDPHLERLGPERWRPLLALAFFLSGVIGWFLALLSLPWVSLGYLRISPGSWTFSLAIAGVLGTLVGLGIATFERLRDRLTQSVVRIKEMEFGERELATARAIQERLLPPGLFRTSGCRIRAANRPAGFVAGDFYEYFRIADGRMAVAVGDVSGKGTGASLIMASAKAMLPFVIGEGGAAEALRDLNRRLCERLAPREFVALALLLFRPATGEGELANAGLPDPYRIRGDGGVEPLAVPGPRLPLGLRREVAYESTPFRLEPGDRLLLTTDGLPEAPARATSEPIGYARFAALVEAAAAAADPVAALFDAVELESTSPRADDWTALVLERPA